MENYRTTEDSERLIGRIKDLKSSHDSEDFMAAVPEFHEELLGAVTDKFPNELADALNLPLWQELASSSIPEDFEPDEVSDEVQNLVNDRIEKFLQAF